MSTLLLGIGIGVMFLGLAIWRFQLVHLLSNVDMNDLDTTKKADLAQYAGFYLIGIGCVFTVWPYLAGLVVAERDFLILFACFIPVNMLVTVAYLAGLGRYMKK